MRPLWSGTLSVGMITIPVRLHAAVESGHEVRFRLLDKKTLTPIREIRVNPETGKEVPWEQVVRGVEVTRGKYVGLTPEELEALPLSTVRTIDLSGFVEGAAIDPVFYDQTYYLAPGPGGAKAYALLLKALDAAGRVGLGKVTIRTREHPVVIRPRGRALLVHTLFYADEVRGEDAIPDLPAHARLHPNELKMATQLVESMAEEFRPAQLRSEYKQALARLVKAKRAGTLRPPGAETAGKVIDLQEALRESLRRARRTGPRRLTRGVPARGAVRRGQSAAHRGRAAG